MKLKELLNVIDKDQPLFISIYTDHDIPTFFKGKPETLQTNRGIELYDEILDSHVIYISGDAYGSSLYIDARREQENEI